MKSMFFAKVGLVTVCSGSILALSASCGESSSGTDMYRRPDMSQTGDMATQADPPTISSLSKASDYTSGGSTITINGSNFRTGASVKFGDTSVPALSTTVSLDGNSIVVTVPANSGRPGKVDITITNSDGSSIKQDKAFLYYLQNLTFGVPNVISGTGIGVRAVYALDIDGDKDIDLLTVNGEGKSISVFLNDSRGTFTLKGTQAVVTTCVNPFTATIADVTGEGTVDVIVPCQGATEASFFKGNGDGTFVAPVKVTLTGSNKPQAIVALDFVNNDQMLDIMVASNGTQTKNIGLFSGNNTGAFTAVATQPTTILNSAYNMKTFDLNGDGKPEIVSTHMLAATANNVVVYTQPPATTASYMSGGINPYDVAAADFDNDGMVDLVFANEGSNTFSLLTQGQNTTFAIKGTPTSTVTADPQAIVAADLDLDGNYDVVTANYNTTTLTSPGDLGIFRGDGTGGFGARVPLSTGSSSLNGKPQSVVVADFNGDGRPDIAATNYLSTGGQLIVMISSGI